MKKSQQPITREYLNQKLGQMMESVARGFAECDKRFDLIDQRFAKVDERFATIEEHLDDMNESIGKVRYYMFNLDEHFVSNPRFEQFIIKNSLIA